MTETNRLKTYLNGRIIPHDEAVNALREMDLGSAGGFYDSARTFGGRLFKLRPHLERLYRGLDATKIDVGLSLEEMEEVTQRVLESNRYLLSRGDEVVMTQVVNVGAAKAPDASPPVNVIIYCQLLDPSPFARSYTAGVRVVTPVTYGVPNQRPEPGQGEWTQQVFQLMSSQEGYITECTGANFMFVRGGKINLPDRRHVLPGVSMQTVLELAASLGITVVEDDYSIHDVYQAEEAFVSGTRFCLLPVDTLNGLHLSEGLPGPVTGRLLDAWRDLVGVDFVRQVFDRLPPQR